MSTKVPASERTRTCTTASDVKSTNGKMSTSVKAASGSQRRRIQVNRFSWERVGLPPCAVVVVPDGDTVVMVDASWSVAGGLGLIRGRDAHEAGRTNYQHQDEDREHSGVYPLDAEEL